MSINKTNIFEKANENSFGFSHVGIDRWHYGIMNAFPLWVDFLIHDMMRQDAFFKHDRPNKFVVELILEGQMEVEIYDKVVVVSSGDMLILPAEVPNVLRCNVPECRKISFSLCGCCVDIILQAFNIKIAETFHLTNLRKFIEILEEFKVLFKKQDEEDIPEVYALINKMIMEIRIQCNVPKVSRRLAQAIQLLNINISKNIKIEDISKELHISYETLYALFKSELNISPKAYLTQIRMNKAKILLAKKDVNIKEIAYDCGYNHPVSFAREFHKFYGISPSEFKGTSKN